MKSLHYIVKGDIIRNSLERLHVGTNRNKNIERTWNIKTFTIRGIESVPTQPFGESSSKIIEKSHVFPTNCNRRKDIIK